MKTGDREERRGVVWWFGVETVKEGFGGLIGGEKGSC